MILKCNFSSSYFVASYGSNPICKGCLSCSKDNGCIRCQHKLFFFLRREGMRQYGECLHSCPSGYYGLRTPDMNRCSSEFHGFFICSVDVFESSMQFLLGSHNSHSVFKVICCGTQYFYRSHDLHKNLFANVQSHTKICYV